MLLFSGTFLNLINSSNKTYCSCGLILDKSGNPLETCNGY